MARLASRIAAGLLGGWLMLGSAGAQDSAAIQCIVATQEQFGSLAFLLAECASRQDCTYQAPIGNASALVVLNNAAHRVQDCWLAAGLNQTQEQREAQGVIRTYMKSGETCKLALSMRLASMAEGFRAACQSQ